jgi:hypothetical protein
MKETLIKKTNPPLSASSGWVTLGCALLEKLLNNLAAKREYYHR